MTFQCAVLPIVEEKEFLRKAAKIADDLTKKGFNARVFREGRIGDKYREQDRRGTPYCITVDAKTLKDDTVSLRYKTSKLQIRVNVADIPWKL